MQILQASSFEGQNRTKATPQNGCALVLEKARRQYSMDRIARQKHFEHEYQTVRIRGTRNKKEACGLIFGNTT